MCSLCIEYVLSNALADMHASRAIFQIPKADPPKLTNPEDWSPALNDFLQRCLIKDPLKRPHPAELLKHPFVCSTEVKHSIMIKKYHCIKYSLFFSLLYYFLLGG